MCETASSMKEKKIKLKEMKCHLLRDKTLITTIANKWSDREENIYSIIYFISTFNLCGLFFRTRDENKFLNSKNWHPILIQ